MDIARPDIARAKKRRLILYSIGSAAVIAGVSYFLVNLPTAAPPVDRDTVYMDTVERGSMLRQVRGTGTLVPE